MELLNHSPFSRGWQSARYCDYPQEIVMDFGQAVQLSQIQFLSHQFKISSKVEIYIYYPVKYKKFKKIGYLTLDSNEKTNFQAREIKTVHIDYICEKVKLVLNRCFPNKENLFNQIGLIAVNFLGQYLSKNLDNVNENANPMKGQDKLEDEMIFDPTTLKRLKTLYKAKERAIEAEQFDEAETIKVEIDRLKGVSQQLVQLEERKRIAIQNEDYASAQAIKIDVERLRNAVSGVNVREFEQPTKQVNTNMNYAYGNKYYADPTDLNEQTNNQALNEFAYDGRNFNKVPITSDVEMGSKTKGMKMNHENANEGYRIAKGNQPTNNNAESQVIKGMNKDFNKVLDEQLNQDAYYGGSPEEEDDDLPAALAQVADSLFPVLTFDLVKKMFSKNWRRKEDGVQTMIREITAYPNSQILGAQPVDKLVTALTSAASVLLDSSQSQALILTMEMLKLVFNKFRSVKLGGFLRTEFDHSIDSCLIKMHEKVGNDNFKLKEKAENTILETANFPAVGDKRVFEHIISGEIKKTLLNSAKHLKARVELALRMIDSFGVSC